MWKVDPISSWNWKRRLLVVLLLLCSIGAGVGVAGSSNAPDRAESLAIAGIMGLCAVALRLILWVLPETAPHDRYRVEIFSAVFFGLITALGVGLSHQAEMQPHSASRASITSSTIPPLPPDFVLDRDFIETGTAEVSHQNFPTAPGDDLCQNITAAADALNASGPVKADTITTQEWVTVACGAKTIEFRKRLAIRSDQLRAGWRARKEDAWSQMHCANSFRGAMDAGWTVAEKIITTDNKIFFLYANCNQQK